MFNTTSSFSVPDLLINWCQSQLGRQFGVLTSLQLAQF